MTDIVEKLRLKSRYLKDSSAYRVMDEAAGEIERQDQEIQLLIGEIERLRAVLANISGATTHDPACTTEALAYIAQQGLEKSPPYAPKD